MRRVQRVHAPAVRVGGSNMNQDYYNYNLTSDEDCCLMMMIEFFEDLGLPEDFSQRAFESLSSKFYANLK